MVEKGICKKVSWVAAKHTTNNSMTISNSSEKRMKTLKEKLKMKVEYKKLDECENFTDSLLNLRQSQSNEID